MKKLTTGLAVALLSGGALACAVKPMPPMIVEVGLLDIASAWFRDDYANPAQAAFLINLDEMGSAIYGDGWRANGYYGHVTIKSGLGDLGLPDGHHIQYIEKPCDTDAEDSADKTSDNNQGSSGGDASGGSYLGFSDETWSIISNWYSNLGKGTVNVGELEPDNFQP